MCCTHLLPLVHVYLNCWWQTCKWWVVLVLCFPHWVFDLRKHECRSHEMKQLQIRGKKQLVMSAISPNLPMHTTAHQNSPKDEQNRQDLFRASEERLIFQSNGPRFRQRLPPTSQRLWEWRSKVSRSKWDTRRFDPEDSANRWRSHPCFLSFPKAKSPEEHSLPWVKTDFRYLLWGWLPPYPNHF